MGSTGRWTVKAARSPNAEWATGADRSLPVLGVAREKSSAGPRVNSAARVGEEVVVSKEAVQRTEQVHGTVRREEVTVDDSTIAATQIDDHETGISSRS
jgi:hypothetical protein